MKTFSGVRIAPGHTHQIFDPNEMPNLVKRLVRTANSVRKFTDFNCLAGSGHSSVPLLGALGLKLNLPFIAVRKSQDTDNDIGLVNGFFPNEGTRYLIIDDLISSGTTVKRIVDNIHKTAADRRYDNVKCVGILLHNSDYGCPFYYSFHERIPTFFAGKLYKKPPTLP